MIFCEMNHLTICKVTNIKIEEEGSQQIQTKNYYDQTNTTTFVHSNRTHL